MNSKRNSSLFANPNISFTFQLTVAILVFLALSSSPVSCMPSEETESFWKRAAPKDFQNLELLKRFNDEDAFWKRSGSSGDDADSFWKRSSDFESGDSFWKRSGLDHDSFWKRSMSDEGADAFWKRSGLDHDSFWKRSMSDEGADAFWKRSADTDTEAFWKRSLNGDGEVESFWKRFSPNEHESEFWKRSLLSSLLGKSGHYNRGSHRGRVHRAAATVATESESSNKKSATSNVKSQ